MKRGLAFMSRIGEDVNPVQYSRKCAASLLTLCAAGLAVTSCSPISFGDHSSEKFLKTGSIAVALSLPEETSAISPGTNNSLLGFMPLPVDNSQPILHIHRDSGALVFHNSPGKRFELEAHGLNGLQLGRFQVVHKQKDALWHASDQYYTKRGLPAPPEGDRQRFLKGALGSAVLFLDMDTPIHNGPIWLEEIGGAQVRSENFLALYEELPVGSQVIVY